MRCSTLILLAIVITLFGCASQTATDTLRGRYVSDDDFGVFVFRADGTFGYKVPSKHALYSEDKLPPDRGRYKVVGTRVEFSDLPADQPKFHLELRDAGRAFLLVRDEWHESQNPVIRRVQLPQKALYKKK